MPPSRLFLMVSAQAALLASVPLVGSPVSNGWLSGVAQAQEEPAPKPDYEAAKRHYQNAEQAAAKNDWSTAAKEYGIAYEITRDAVLFFKLGNAYQLSGDCTRAVEYFERYLSEAKPSEEYVKDTQARIHDCQSSVAAGTDDDPAPGASEGPETSDSPLAPSMGAEVEDDLPQPETQPSFMDEETTWQATAAWTSVGLTVAFLSAGAVMGLSAKSREEDLDNLLRYTDANGRPADFDSTVSSRFETLQDEGEAFNTYSMIALGLAGGAATAAIVFFFLDEPVGDEDQGLSTVTPLVGGDALGVNAGFRF